MTDTKIRISDEAKEVLDDLVKDARLKDGGNHSRQKIANKLILKQKKKI